MAGTRSARTADAALVELPTWQAANPVNLSRNERFASLAGGAALALYGAYRRDLIGALLTLVSGGLLARGLTGHGPIYAALDINRAGIDKGHPASVPHQRGNYITEPVMINRR